MAERLKDRFGTEVPAKIAEMISAVDPTFDSESFVADALDGYDDLELTDRARTIAAALANHLPADRAEALRILVRSLGEPIADQERLEGMASFIYLPHVFFVAAHGLDHFEEAMAAQYELTKRFTAEFSIRAFIEREPDRTLERLRLWASDPDPHVRRLVSEGTRPRLPWAHRLRRFVDDPSPVVDLLDLLFDDESLYVRRSVANNLNDISKDHPEHAVDTARRWGAQGADQFVVRHGLRTLVKQGHPGALAVLGFDHGSDVEVSVECEPSSVPIGGKVRITAEVTSKDLPLRVLVDLVVHFVKANGTTSPKVFKGGELELDPGESNTIRKTVSAAVHTTRRPYPGTHTIDVMVNGEARRDVARFEITR